MKQKLANHFHNNTNQQTQISTKHSPTSKYSHRSLAPTSIPAIVPTLTPNGRQKTLQKVSLLNERTLRQYNTFLIISNVQVEKYQFIKKNHQNTT